MPLAYDDIPGSWADYSLGWPQVEFDAKHKTDVLKFCVAHITYGCYVFIDKGYRKSPTDHVRLEQQEQAAAVSAFVRTLAV